MASAQFVIAGRNDCEQYARLEAAADFVQSRLPSVAVYKEPQPAALWPSYLRRTCAAQGWDLPADPAAPLVWRPLVERGGRALLVGGVSEFLQLVAVYYGLAPPELDAAGRRQRAACTALQAEAERQQRRQQRIALERALTRVAVIGAETAAGYQFLAALAAGTVLPGAGPLRLQLLGDPDSPPLAALRMELHDLASAHVAQVALLSTPREAVREAALVIIIEPTPNLPPPPPTPSPPPPSPSPPPPPRRSRPAVPDSDSAEPAEEPAAAEAADAPAAPAAPPAAPALEATPSITISADEPAAGDLSPRGDSARRRQSGDARTLSVIMEDPESEEKEEKEDEELAKSRPGSARRGYQTPGYLTSQAATGGAGGAPGLDRSQEPAQEAPAGDDVARRLADSLSALVAESDGGEAGDSRAAVDGAGSPGRVSPDDGRGACGGDEDDGIPAAELAELFARMRLYARAIDETGGRHCRVVVAGGRAPCFAASVALQHLPRLPPTNVLAVCQPRANHLRAVLAAELGVAPQDVHGAVEWGNPPAGRSWVDLDAAAVSRHRGAIRGPAGYRRPVLDVLPQARRWLAEQLPRLLRQRAGTERLPAGADTAGLTQASCLADTVRRWWAAAEDGALLSLGVAADGSHHVPAGLVFSAPVRLLAGDFRVCRAQQLGPEAAAAVRAAADQLVGWLRRFGVELARTGPHCTISDCGESVDSSGGGGGGERAPRGEKQSSEDAVSSSEKSPSEGRPTSAEDSQTPSGDSDAGRPPTSSGDEMAPAAPVTAQ